MKRPNPKMLNEVDEMMRCWQSPQRAALKEVCTSEQIQHARKEAQP